MNAAVTATLEVLVRVYRPFRVYLFGSYARQEALSDSDQDFLLILQTPQEVGQAWKLQKEVSKQLKNPIALDLLFRSRDEFEANSISGPAEVAIEEGQLVYCSETTR